jgi:hypothetical protein
MSTRAQISIEYLILMGFVLLLIIVPVILLLSSSGTTGVARSVTNAQAVEIGGNLVNDAKQVYYLGLYSKKQVSYQIPTGLEKMFVVDIASTTDSSHHYYFGLVFPGKGSQNRYMFESDVPLHASDEANHHIDSADNPGVIPECDSGQYSCSFYNFRSPITKSGIKSFKLETTMINSEVVVDISPII